MAFDGLTWTVVLAAFSIAVLHTAIGPDHTLPFVALARARGWTLRRTLLVTAACGAGHVLSSVAIVGGALLLGESTGWIEALEEGRGSLAAWGFVALGLAYGLWGVRRALRRRAGIPLPRDGSHPHVHAGPRHERARGREVGASSGALFLVFVLGPCEPMIPLAFLPATQGRLGLAAVSALVFCLATVLTMLALVAVAHAGARRLPLGPLERWSHALAGGVVTASGTAVLLGL